MPTKKDCVVCKVKIGVASKTCQHCGGKQPYKDKLERQKDKISHDWKGRQNKNCSINKVYDATNLLLHKWELLERHPVLLLAKKTTGGFVAECLCPWQTDTEDAKDAFAAIKRIYESLLNVTAATRTKETAAQTSAETTSSTSPSPPVSTPCYPPVSASPAPPVSTPCSPLVSTSIASPVSSSPAPPVPTSFAPLVSTSIAPPVSTPCYPPVSASPAPLVSTPCPLPISTFPAPKMKRKMKRNTNTSGLYRGAGPVAALLWMWSKVEKLLGAKRQH